MLLKSFKLYIFFIIFLYFTDLQLKQVKTENKNIVFETSKFSAFENQWMIRAYCHADVNKNICYQLAVKSKLIRYVCLRKLACLYIS